MTDQRIERPTLPWIQVAPDAPYFVTEDGEPWAPIGHNDAVTWPELAGLFRRRDLPGVEAHLRWLASCGVTCLRLMLEYGQREHRYIERPAGRFVPNMVQLWDDLFAICERVGIRILLTPFDTFFIWRRWQFHPYNRDNGGPCADRAELLACARTRDAIKARLAFATERWGASGALFAWDLWNEIYPTYDAEDREVTVDFVSDIGGFLRELETRLHGRAHPQTASVFEPDFERHPWYRAAMLAHPALDFANSHFYQHGTIDDPANTVDAALAVGRLTRASLADTPDGRPFFDSEHGPIHAFKDRHEILPEPFDDEYFRHMQWAHLASGAAGGGLRWPNRHPHLLTRGMRAAQRTLACFLPLIDWTTFRRRNLNEELCVEAPGIAGFACGDEAQAVVWLLRTDSIGADGMLRGDAPPVAPRIGVPGLGPGRYRVSAWDTDTGAPRGALELCHDGAGPFAFDAPPLVTDVALAIRRLGARDGDGEER